MSILDEYPDKDNEDHDDGLEDWEREFWNSFSYYNPP